MGSISMLLKRKIVFAPNQHSYRCPTGVSRVRSGFAPWADLPRDLCEAVLDCVLESRDAMSTIRFPAVCAAWYAASMDHNGRRHLPSGAPTLLKSWSALHPHGYEDFEYNLDDGNFGLHDVATGKSYRSEVEGLKERTWVGGKDDWLVTTDLSCNIELLNPITGTHVPLPSFETIPGIEVISVSYRGPGVSIMTVWTGYAYWREPTYILQRVKLCRKPTHLSDDYLAVALFSVDHDSLVAFTATNDNRWTLLKNPNVELERFASQTYSPNKFTDVTVHKGKLVAVARSGHTYFWDMVHGATSDPTMFAPPNFESDEPTKIVYYLATSNGGDLQLVSLFGDYADSSTDRRRFVIELDSQWSLWPERVLLYELNANTGAWQRVRDLGGGHALFVGANYPFYGDVPRNGTKDLLRADCVYVADLCDCDAGIFEMGNEFDFDAQWREHHLFYPGMNDPMQMPMWFRPSVAR